MSTDKKPEIAPLQPPTFDADIMPPPGTGKPRTIVMCFDGTGEQFDADNSNVVKFFSLLQKDDHREQLVYYQAGIGTYRKGNHFTGPITSKILKLVDEAVAWSLDGHVKEGYQFLMDKYQTGDKICIFGFSRGAYTARSLAGMIQKVGLLPSGNDEQVPFAYKMYKRTDSAGWKQSAAFKKAFSIDVDVEFVGVWDTVCSVGLTSRRLPFVSSNSAIRYFRHALSLDERRAKFKANQYNRPTAAEQKLGVQPGEMPKSGVPTRSKFQLDTLIQKWRDRKTDCQIEEEEQAGEEDQFTKQDLLSLQTDVHEVWFAGCHGDVGGGSVPNESKHNLARIPLRWMIRECFKCNTGIRFHSSLLRQIGLDPDSLYPYVKDRPPALYAIPSAPRPTHGRGDTDASAKTLVDQRLSEEEEDLQDALCPLYDQLVDAKLWWILEVIPLDQRYQRTEDDEWVEKPVINMGRGRTVPKGPVFNVHRSVKIRMEAKELSAGRYSPFARFETQPTFVD